MGEALESNQDSQETAKSCTVALTVWFDKLKLKQGKKNVCLIFKMLVYLLPPMIEIHKHEMEVCGIESWLRRKGRSIKNLGCRDPTFNH